MPSDMFKMLDIAGCKHILHKLSCVAVSAIAACL